MQSLLVKAHGDNIVRSYDHTAQKSVTLKMKLPHELNQAPENVSWRSAAKLPRPIVHLPMRVGGPPRQPPMQS